MSSVGELMQKWRAEETLRVEADRVEREQDLAELAQLQRAKNGAEWARYYQLQLKTAEDLPYPLPPTTSLLTRVFEDVLAPSQPLVSFKRLSSTAKLPEYATPGASGADIFSDEQQAVYLMPGKPMLFKTGLQVELPPGFELQVRAKSGRALKEGLGLANGIGTVDSDYRGELGVILINQGNGVDSVEILPGQKIAQIVIVPVIQAKFAFKDELSDTDRGQGGFGSTGLGVK
jgi:dUTP pyrophosphatase